MHDFKTIFYASIVLIISTVLFFFYDLKESIYVYSLNMRLGQMIGILLIGYAIAISSVLFQSITNNKILTPSILGFNSLYLMIQSLVIWLFSDTKPNFWSVNEFFAFSVIIMIGFSFILYKLLFKSSVKNIYFILLAGVVCGTVFSSISSFINRLIETDRFQLFQLKAYANFDLIQSNLLPISIVLILLCSYIVYRKIPELDVYLIGSDNAKMLGIDIDRLQIISLCVISVMVSISTVLVGPITFLGLIVSNIAYTLLRSYSLKYIFPLSILFSWIILSLGLILTQRIITFDINLTMLINAFGGIYFIYLLIWGSSNDKNK